MSSRTIRAALFASPALFAFSALLAACSSTASMPNVGEGGNSTNGGTVASSGGTSSAASGGAQIGGVANGGAPSGGAQGGGSASAGAQGGGAQGGGSLSAGAPNGGSASGGAPSGGATSGGASSAGAQNGGASSSGAAGGTSSGGGGSTISGGSTAGGGASSGGSSSGGATTGGSTSATATPSAGCSKMTPRPSNGVVTQSDRIYNFPASYDGKTPMPLLLGLHAAGNPMTQIQSLSNGTRLDTNFVRVFPKSAGSAWVYATDKDKVKAVVDDVLANYCIDTSRLFATGHSSGAQMVVQVLCGGETRFKAVAPVAASKYCSSLTKPIPVMYIQGQMDAQRGGGNGIDVVNFFVSTNKCASTTTPKSDVPSCTSTFDKMQVTPGCVTYQGCNAPTVWCSHNDNGYNSTDGKQHGWPCFASNAMSDFFMALP
ncbi:MAG: hypothetical protein QM756_19390 [Polyangiaceae bacterium]